MADRLPALFDADALDCRVTDPAHHAAIAAALARADEERWGERLVTDRDETLWNPAAGEAAAGHLGWLTAPLDFADRVPALEAFGEAIRDAGFTTALVLAPDCGGLGAAAIVGAFGSIEGWLPVTFLDSTDPAAVAAAWEGRDPLATLVVLAAAAGITPEAHALLDDAWKRIETALRRAGERRESPGEFIVAITDTSRGVDDLPHHDALREVFVSPVPIGRPHSGIGYPGLVPASLAGIDIDALVAAGNGMLARLHAVDPGANPGVALGVTLGVLAAAGRDKVTVLADPELRGLEAWLAQLLAGTGRSGAGIVPVAGEPPGAPGDYGDDRVFVRLALEGSGGQGTPGGTGADEALDALEAAGHPVLRIRLADPIDVAGEFLRWGVAAAIAGTVLEIDPLRDEPPASRDITRRILAEPDRLPRLLAAEPLATAIPLALHGDAALRLTAGDGTVVGELRRHLGRVGKVSYLALEAYLAPTAAATATLTRIRTALRAATRSATLAGFGPAAAHATGILHAGGPATGWFIVVTADHPSDLPVPGRPYSFGQLVDAQALGEIAVLEERDLPVLRIHISGDVEQGLAALEAAIAAATTADPA